MVKKKLGVLRMASQFGDCWQKMVHENITVVFADDCATLRERGALVLGHLHRRTCGTEPFQLMPAH